MEHALSELRRLALAHAENRITETPIPRIAMVRGEVPEHRMGGMYEPMVNLILQGSKTLVIGDQAIRFDSASYFVISIDAPATGSVEDAGPGRPFLAVSLTLDPTVIAALLADVPDLAPRDGPTGGFSTCSVTPELLDVWLRLLRLVDRREDIPALAASYEREILYRVLQGPQGGMLRALVAPDSALARVRRAIDWLRRHYDETIPVETLAEIAAMSASAFHRHFKAVTSMTPIQFQKQIRLLEARRRLIVGVGTASAVAFEVGYESASQFSREYARFFGMPPARDMKSIRSGTGK